jgi:hypothetical protein
MKRKPVELYKKKEILMQKLTINERYNQYMNTRKSIKEITYVF